MSTIMVLGGGGFLAGHIERHFCELGWRVVSVGRRASGLTSGGRHIWELPHPDFAHLLAVEQPEICVNAAGRASVLDSMVNPYTDFEASTLLNFKILQDLRQRSAASIYIHLSSAAVYGNPVQLPVQEDASSAPISPYGLHRRLTELVLEQHAKLFSVRTASLRIFSAYGVGLRRQVVWDIATRAFNDRGRKLLLQGSPEDSRDFVHGSDVAAAVQLVAERGDLIGECYNVAAGKETTISELANLILRLLGRSSEIEFDSNRVPGNPMRWQADITKVRGLGFAPKIRLQEGVRELISDLGRTCE